MTEPAGPMQELAHATRRRLLFSCVAAVAALCGAGLAWWKSSTPPSREGVDPALWLRQFETPSGALLELRGFQGKPLVLNFWATWCPPCVEEMPLLDRFYRENSAKGWQVVGLAIDRADPVRRFLREHPVGFPVGLAESSGAELCRNLGNLAGGLPFSLVVDSDGFIVQRKMGRVSASDIAAWSGLGGAG